MIRFIQELFKFEERAHMCGKEDGECCVKIDMPICAGAIEEVLIEKCILAEVQSLWEKGIKTLCSCCGHGLPYQAFITVEKGYEKQMEELGYESPPDLLEVCENCNIGIMYTPKSVLTEEMYEKG